MPQRYTTIKPQTAQTSGLLRFELQILGQNTLLRVACQHFIT